MSGLVELLLSFHNWRNGVGKVKESLKQKNPSAIKFGVLSAASFNYPVLFDPVETHPDVIITAIAARSLDRARAQISKFKLNGVKAYGSYEELIQDADVDAIYIPVPNSLHSKWALAAMKAGKHVLIEKPISSNAAEAREIQACAEATGKVALEAYHWRFHPAAHRVKEIVESGQYGALKSTFSKMTIPPGSLAADDTRFNYSLGGGSSMDLAYVFSSSLYFASTTSNVKDTLFEVLEAKPLIHKGDKRIDEGMDTTIMISHPESSNPAVKCTTVSRLVTPRVFGFISPIWDAAPLCVLELERASIEFTTFVSPWIGHKIIVTEKPSGKKHTETCYKGGPLWGSRGETWWTTYRYQLEAFVERVKNVNSDNASKNYEPWVTLDESVKIMEIVDSVYEKAQMPKRGTE